MPMSYSPPAPFLNGSYPSTEMPPSGSDSKPFLPYYGAQQLQDILYQKPNGFQTAAIQTNQQPAQNIAQDLLNKLVNEIARLFYPLLSNDFKPATDSEKLLQALSQAIEPDESAIHFTFQQDSTSLAAEILTIVTTELTSDHHGKFIDTLASSLLFDPKTGVLRILRSSKGISRHDRAKVFIFNTLTAFIPKLGASSILPYAVQIITTCMAIFRSQDSSRVKLASFRPVEQILDLGIPHSTVDLSVDRLFEQYYMTYIQQYTKISLSGITFVEF
ncbi:hypothetical protein BSLG_005816 [Batrachochytrium salamandrivorans]|nr:hypothetical protein BSLG_005816 [Batrachochytrium salamandrivorans]